MNYIGYLLLVLISITACTSFDTQKTNKTQFYYDENSRVNALIVPPDLTLPNYNDSADIDKLIFDTKDILLVGSDDITVAREGSYRYLIVNKEPVAIWQSIIDFFKQQKFNIVKKEERIGLLETNYLKRNLKAPAAELNIIRSSLQKALGTSNVLPVVDKYIVRLEKNAGNTEIYLSASSMEEINASGDDNTTWRLRARDAQQESAMIYRLMVFLGGNKVKAQQSIDNAQDNNELVVSINTTDTGDTTLRFVLDKEQVWRYIGWALDDINVGIDDKDLKEGAYYINLTDNNNKGFFFGIFDSSDQSYQLLVRQLDYEDTEVSLNYLTDDENNQEFNKSFLTKIANALNSKNAK